MQRTTLSAAIDPPPILGRGAVRDPYIALTAAVANLMRVAASGEASSSARSLALLVGVASLRTLCLIAQKGPLPMAPSRPGRSP